MADPPSRILVRGPNPVGDLVMATGRFADLRASFPNSRISLAIKPGRSDVVDGSDAFDEIIIDDSHLGPRAALALVRRLRRERFDLAVVLTNALRTAIVLALSGIARRVGFARGGQGPFLTDRVPAEKLPDGRWRPTPMPELYGRVTAAAGGRLGDGWPRLHVPAALEERYRARRREFGIGEGEQLIGIVPGAAFGASKLWAPGSIAAVADELTRRTGLRSMLFCAPGEEPIAKEIVAAMKSRPLESLERPLGLGLLKPFIRDLRLLFTMDTGPRHYATAFRVPTLSILGPTHPDWTGAHLDFQEVVRHDVPCGPCQLPRCPLDHRCLREITPEEVLSRFESLDRRIGGGLLGGAGSHEVNPGAGRLESQRTGKHE
jgi:heptosyltransferase-2